LGIATNAAMLLLAGAPAVYLATKKPLTDLGLIMTVGVLAAFTITSLFFLVIRSTMRYVINSNAVHILCGPFDWIVPMDQIESIVEKDLGYMPLSEGWKLPGYALFSMRFSDVGKVRMCATSMTKKILLLQTRTDQWGITPADISGFLSVLKERMRSPAWAL
jgi:hypothetical protein